MSSRYLVSEMLCSIKNNGLVGNDHLIVDYSNLCLAVAAVLKDEGYLVDYKIVQSAANNVIRKINLKLKFKNSKNLIGDVKIFSKPSCRIYITVEKLIAMMQRNPFAVIIVSTSKGVMTGKQAIEIKAGGELLCVVF